MASSVTGYRIPGYFPELPPAKATTFIQQYGNLPIHSSSDMDEMLAGMVKFGHASPKDSFTGTTSVDVKSIMKNSAHIDRTEGSPGTIFIAPGDEPGKFTVSVVNQLGDACTTTIRKRAEGGWLNSTPGRIYRDFRELTEHLFLTIGAVAHVVGDSMGILFFTPEQRKLAIAKLEYSAPGTYICFAHEPTEEFKEIEEGPPTKRNVIMWKSEDGLNLAFFHYDSTSRQFLNGGPNRLAQDLGFALGCTGGSISPAKRVEILSDSTLGGLIGKKIRGQGLEPTPLILDTIA
ncbi:MAG: hypothetical protein NTX49_02310 [Chlamydiae bacterium]|nr:hypothetical protein [Chlamydiota bacterium]